MISGFAAINSRIPLNTANSASVRDAVRYTGRDGSPVSLTRRGNQVCIIVCDRGTGVPEDSLGRIFDPFYQVGGDRVSGRGGLGLAIAKRAVERLSCRSHIEAQNAAPGLLVKSQLPA